MWDTGVSQFHVGAGIADAIGLNGDVQPDMGGIIEPDSVQALVDSLSDDQTGGGLYPLDLASEAVFVAVAADTAGAVAAHFTGASIIIVKPHPIIAALNRRINDHQTIGADGELPVAKRTGQRRKDLGG